MPPMTSITARMPLHTLPPLPRVFPPRAPLPLTALPALLVLPVMSALPVVPVAPPPSPACSSGLLCPDALSAMVESPCSFLTGSANPAGPACLHMKRSGRIRCRYATRSMVFGLIPALPWERRPMRRFRRCGSCLPTGEGQHHAACDHERAEHAEHDGADAAGDFGSPVAFLESSLSAASPLDVSPLASPPLCRASSSLPAVSTCSAVA